MNFRIVCVAIGLLALGFAFFAQGQRAIADTRTLTPSKDNSIYQNLPNNSNGRAEHLYVGRSGSGTRRALIAFDLAGSGIPAGSTITGATLTLVMDRTGFSFSNETIRLFRVTSDWGEANSDSDNGIGPGAAGGSGAAAQVQDATWQARFFPATPWDTAGGDFAATESASRVVPNIVDGVITPFTWSSAQMVNEVQGWLADSSANFGWIIRGDEIAPRSASRFVSRDHPTVANRPMLTINFTVPVTRLPGDVDNDSDVDLADFKLMSSNLGLATNATQDQGDFNSDGRVGIRDLVILRNNLGRTNPSPELGAAAVPEPAGACYLVLLGVVVFGRWAARRRRLTG